MGRFRGLIADVAATLASLYRSSAHSHAGIIEDISSHAVHQARPVRHTRDKNAWKHSRPNRFKPKHNKKNYGGPKHRH